jgi:hypothetical protein
MHGGEVVYIVKVTNSVLPGDAAFESLVQAQCVPAYRSYTGREYDTDTIYEMPYFVPTSAGWLQGDHEVVCYAARVDRKAFRGTVKATR